MAPTVFEFLGRLLRRTAPRPAMVRRTRHPAPMPMLAIRKTKSVPSRSRRRTYSRMGLGQKSLAPARTNRRVRTKKPLGVLEPSQTSIIPTSIAAFDTCPSCGLQAPGSLLTEHFLGSPSHRNGPPKIVEADPLEAEAVVEAEEEDSKQSVRNLLQMLVPPRAFGRRHADKSVMPISLIVKNLDAAQGRTRRL